MASVLLWRAEGNGDDRFSISPDESATHILLAKAGFTRDSAPGGARAGADIQPTDRRRLARWQFGNSWACQRVALRSLLGSLLRPGAHILGLSDPVFGHPLEIGALFGRTRILGRHPQGRSPDLAHDGEVFCIRHDRDGDPTCLNHA
jgi:hypothetical protein